jgi:hypothetical protein
MVLQEIGLHTELFIGRPEGKGPFGKPEILTLRLRALILERVKTFTVNKCTEIFSCDGSCLIKESWGGGGGEKSDAGF